ncbi:MAG: hypothetical protein J6Y04_05510 [Bacteroidaceae bacterium]|nr:hypothetical protein [Bacteroidaceae bacterium]
METTEIKKTEIVKARSVWECMSDGLSASFEYMGASLRGLWPLLIVFSLVAPALLIWWTKLFFGQLFDGTLAALTTTPTVGICLRALAPMGLLLLLGLMDAVMHGGIIWRQRQLTEMGFIPNTPAWREWRGIGRMTWRMIVFALLLIVLSVVIAVINVGMTMGLAAVIRHWGLSPVWAVGLTIVNFLLYMVIVFYMLVVLLHMVLPYVYDDTSLLKSITSAKWGIRPVSGTFCVVFAAGVSSILFALIFVLPTGVIQIVDLLAMKATVMGDAASLPTSMPVWRYIAMALMFLGSFVCNVVFLYPILYRWGAMKSEEAKPATAEIN